MLTRINHILQKVFSLRFQIYFHKFKLEFDLFRRELFQIILHSVLSENIVVSKVLTFFAFTANVVFIIAMALLSDNVNHKVIYILLKSINYLLTKFTYSLTTYSLSSDDCNATKIPNFL